MHVHVFIDSFYPHQESVNTRGNQAEVESASYEIRLFSEMLLKGAVNIFEVSGNISKRLSTFINISENSLLNFI